jgi:hypothetical protein
LLETDEEEEESEEDPDDESGDWLTLLLKSITFFFLPF